MGEYVFGTLILGYFGLVVYMWDVGSGSAPEDTKDGGELKLTTKQTNALRI